MENKQNFLTRNWQLIRDWLEIKQDNMIHNYDFTIIDVTGVEQFPVISPRENN